MHHSAYPLTASVGHDRARVVLGVARVHDDGPAKLSGKRDLRGERGALSIARGMIVVVVEAAFAYGDRSGIHVLPNRGKIARRVKRRSVMRVNASRPAYQISIGLGDRASACRRCK
jgi:hypothetical protein